MADVSRALLDTARLLRELKGDNVELSHLRISRAKLAREDDVIFSGLEELAIKLEGGYFELERLRGEVARLGKLQAA